jgi:hypothetical protein
MTQLMTKSEYVVNRCQGKMATFRLSSGITLHGMVAAYFPDEPHKFYYVATGNVNAFRSMLRNKNYAEMRQLCVQINPANIVSAEVDRTIVH